jgi:hypothetical protein
MEFIQLCSYIRIQMLPRSQKVNAIAALQKRIFGRVQKECLNSAAMLSEGKYQPVGITAI